MVKALDLGCGRHKIPGAIGVDISPDRSVDIIHELNSFPYPFETSSFEAIHCRHIIEHIEDLVPFFNEIHRIGKRGCLVKGVMPHFSSACSYSDPTHRHHLGVRMFEFFCSGEIIKRKWLKGRFDRLLGMRWPNIDYYNKTKFRLRSIHLEFSPVFRKLGIEWLANRDLDFYEFYLCGFLPARDIHFELEVVK